MSRQANGVSASVTWRDGVDAFHDPRGGERQRGGRRERAVAVRRSSSRGEEIEPTAASSLLSGSHGRRRRSERRIAKVELQRARRYGMRERARHGRLKYTFGGVTFIYDPSKNREVTSYVSTALPMAPRALSSISGTRATRPIQLAKKYSYCTDEELQLHEAKKEALSQSKDRWKSHSVLVVDMSGSMRLDDVNGARCRSDGVWMALAKDFVGSQLEGGLAGAEDLVSVVLMRETAEVVAECEPMDWVLYNRFVDFREWDELRPEGHGNYFPALEKAEELLGANTTGSCALSLLFLSDGKPSDMGKSRGEIAERVGRMASRFGRRLSVSCIGMAEPGADFSTLADMADEAESYGATARFDRPSLCATALSGGISSLASSLSTTKTELTCLQTGRTRKVRTDVVRERRCAPDDPCLSGEWKDFHNNNQTQYVQRIWTWDCDRDDFVYIRDVRCIYCYKQVGGEGAIAQGSLCPDCQGCHICFDCLNNEANEVHAGGENCRNFAADRRCGRMVSKFVTSFSVAMKTSAFGEGVERLVHRFRFLDDDKNFVGKKWVAKESRFVENLRDFEARMNYHKDFMRTQVLAQQFAKEFNLALAALEGRGGGGGGGGGGGCGLLADLRIPRVRFLEPLVVELFDNGLKLNILIEEMLEGRYQKFNNNMGFVDKSSRSRSSNKGPKGVRFATSRVLGRGGPFSSGREGFLEAIGEERENDVSGSGGDCPARDDTVMRDDEEEDPEVLSGFQPKVRAEDIPQAFSHFTHAKSSGKLMVVDLQGVLHVRNDGRREYVLTDPAIHRRRRRRRGGNRNNADVEDDQSLRLGDLGRTDRGEKGMEAFWETHICTDACRLLGLTMEEH